MVKNEYHTLPRLLSSVQPLLQDPSWVLVCDTGSTDGTWEWVTKQNVLRVQHTWDNFAANRNRCLRQAVDYINSKTDTPQEYYILFLDADHTISTASLQKERLKPTADINMVHIHSTGWANYLPYYISFYAAKQCRYKGVTHEYLDCSTSPSLHTSHYQGFQLHHHADGGNRKNKLERDATLLQNALQDKSVPREMQRRYSFYYARTLEDQGKMEEAQQWYEQRARWGGWIEEAFFAQYSAVKCMIALANSTNEAIEEGLLQAMRMLPYRVEPYYELAKLYRNQNQMPQCVRWCTEGTWRLQQRQKEALFLDESVYQWKLRDELALCLYYTNNQDTAKFIWNTLLENELPLEEKKRIKQNILF